jgi:hypothetical protein
MKLFYNVTSILVYIVISIFIMQLVSRLPLRSLADGIIITTVTLVALEMIAGLYQLLPFSPRQLSSSYGVSCIMVLLFVSTVLLTRNPVNQLIEKSLSMDFNNPIAILVSGVACTSLSFFIVRAALLILRTK